MFAELLEKLWNAIPFVSSRKRNLSCRDSSDDDDDDIMEVMVTSPKRPRMESTLTDSEFPFLYTSMEPSHTDAHWIARSRRRFSQTFFTRMEPKQTGSYRGLQPNSEDVITIDDDGEDPEIVVVPSDSSRMQAASGPKSDLLKRPPLSRRSYPASHVKSKCVTKNVERSTVGNKMNVQNGSRKSISRTSSQRSTPTKQKNSSNNTGLFNSYRIHDLTDRENIPRSSRGSTAEKSVRLDERERYAEILKLYSANNTTQNARSVWPSCPPKQTAINDSRKENIVSRMKSPILKQKMDRAFSTNLMERLSLDPAKMESATVLKPVQESASEVVWLSSSFGSSGVKFVERKLSSLKPKHSVSQGLHRASKPEIEIITLPSTEAEAEQVTAKSKEVIFLPKKPIVLPKELVTRPKEPIAVPKESRNKCKLQENPLLDSVYTKDTWLSDVVSGYKSRDAEMHRQLKLVKADIEEIHKQAEMEWEKKKKNSLRMQELNLGDDEAEEVQEIERLVELTPEMLNKIKEALRPTPPNEVLVEAFNLRITRRDMETLSRDNWLNDEVINFYFTLLSERGKLDNYLSVHVCNTFFYPKLISNGHASLKRWTRKIDIFAHDLMLVPVHLGVHWCLAVVDFRHKKIQYYDSMNGKNQQCLIALKGYLEAESLDKKKVKLDTSDWSLEIVKDKPNQLNGSDCGMFACKYAEYLSRDAKITFTQEDMPYFRRRMVYEILTARLL